MGVYHYGVDFAMPMSTLRAGNREEFKKTVIEPAMKAITQQIDANKITRLTAPLLPKCVDAAASAQTKDLGIRVIHSYDIMTDKIKMRFDTLAESAETAQPDMQVMING